jgi:AAA+ superfamily predicted ATPase
MIKPLPRPPWRSVDFVALLALFGFVAAWNLVRAHANPRMPEVTVLAAVPALATAIVLVCLRVGCYSTNGRIRNFRNRGQYEVFDERYPSYRLVDFLLAAERLSEKSVEAFRVNPSNIHVDLATLANTFSARLTGPPSQERMCIGYEEFGYFPQEAIWLLQGPEGNSPDARFVLRIRRLHADAIIEIGATRDVAPKDLLKRLADDALKHSIFRGQFIEIRYTATPHRDYDYQFESAEMTVTFKPKPNVTAADIILEEKVEGILRRNLFDFYAHRDELFALGLPRKRALLFYGPPGTGKTHTCRFIHTRLDGVTTILATGESLTRLQDIGKLARQLQPTLVILEDVDLVFHTREINPYGTALGDLMDQLDGFTPDEDVIFVLTTNAIERVESAIRDRPGRINQCLFFGMPNPDLRRRYLLQYLKPYNVVGVDLDRVVALTEQTSQAFMKEFVLRAVQIAADASGYATNGVPLTTEHFDIAFDELTSHGDPTGHAIMGFRNGPRGFGVED